MLTLLVLDLKLPINAREGARGVRCDVGGSEMDDLNEATIISEKWRRCIFCNSLRSRLLLSHPISILALQR